MSANLTTLIDKQFRPGHGVPESLITAARHAFEAIVMPVLVAKLGPSKVAGMIRGDIFKITISRSETLRDELDDTSEAGVIAGLGDASSGRLPFKNIVHGSRVFDFLLNQNTMEVEALLWELTATKAGQKTSPTPPARAAAPGYSVAAVPPKPAPKPARPALQPAVATKPAPAPIPVPMHAPAVAASPKPAASATAAETTTPTGSSLSTALDKIMAAARRLGAA